MKTKVKTKSAKIRVKTPVGRFSYPYFANPDSGRAESDNKYKGDLLIPKSTWKTDPDAVKLRGAVLECGRKFYGDKNLELSDFNNPFKDTDKLEKYSSSEEIKGNILIRAKTEFPPVVVGPDKEEMNESEVKKIKGGDYGRFVVVVYPYSQKEGGITLGLTVVQYQKPGKALGGGAAASLAMIDEMEVDMEDLDEEVEDDEDETEAPKKLKKKAKVVEEDEEEEEETPKKRGRPASKKKVVEEDEEEESDEDFDFDDEEDEAA